MSSAKQAAFVLITSMRQILPNQVVDGFCNVLRDHRL
jgi:hypothetical protein